MYLFNMPTVFFISQATLAFLNQRKTKNILPNYLIIYKLSKYFY